MLASDPVPVAALAELAQRSGLGSDAVRARAWPALLALGVDRPSNGDDVYEQRASLLVPKDANQVTLDVNRSHWIRGDPMLSPLSPVSQATAPSGTARTKLARLVQGVVASHPGRSHYYQGLHDIAAILQTALANSTDLTGAAIERLTLGHLRDCVQGGLGAVMDTLRLLPHLIAVADPELHSALFPPSNRSSFGAAKRSNTGGDDDADADDDGGDSFVMLGVADLSDMEHIVGCHFAVSWLLTWFSHGLDDWRAVARLFDLFLASDPLMPLYVGAAAVVKDRDELLRMARGESDEVSGRRRTGGVGEGESSNRVQTSTNLNEHAPVIEGMLHMRLQRLPALTGHVQHTDGSIRDPMDVETDTGRAHKRARVTLRSVDGDSRVVLEVSEDVAEEEAGGTPAPRSDLRARDACRPCDDVIRAALTLHERIPPASLYTILGVRPDPGGAFASYPYPWLVATGLGSPGTSTGTSSHTPTDVGCADEGVFPADGRWATTFPCGTQAYVGDVTHGRRHGLGRHSVNSKDGSHRERYEGEWRMGLRHGRGCAVFDDGARYAGEWSEGRMDGWGVYTWPAPGNAQYRGSFRDDRREGLGVVTHADFRVDAGVWRAGKLETPMPTTCGNGARGGTGCESSTSMTATMRSAAAEASSAAVDAGAAATAARDLADAIAGPRDADSDGELHGAWGGIVDTWPWPETRALVWPPRLSSDSGVADSSARRRGEESTEETFHFRGLGNDRGWNPARLGARIRRGVTNGVREARGALDDLKESDGVRHVRGFMGRLGIGGRGGGGEGDG